MSIEDAVKKFSQKQLPSKRRGKKNKKPEQKTVNACMAFFESRGFSMHVVESRAVYSLASSSYLRGQTIPGFSDSAGCTPNGIGSFVEFKAKDRLSTLRPAQREFLKEKILKGCFACVVDSVELLERIYHRWVELAPDGLDQQIAYLLSCLPRQKKSEQDSNDFF